MARQIELKESEIYADVTCHDEGSERNALVLLKVGRF